jgi:uncharacterized damage-inducible protein DinB
MNKTLMTICISLAASTALADPKPADTRANPISGTVSHGYDRVKKFVADAAAEMPADQYNIKPTPDVRSFGQLVAHVADTQMMFCGLAKHDAAMKNPDFEKTATTKPAIQKALADSIAYCDAVYAGTNDANMTEPVQMFGQKLTRFAALDINVAHDNEHYGNIVTYLRLKKLVPPSSEKK